MDKRNKKHLLLLLISLYWSATTTFVQAQEQERDYTFNALDHTAQERAKISRFENKGFFSNSSISFDLGLQILTTNNTFDYSPYTKISGVARIGWMKYLNYISALRFRLQGGFNTSCDPVDKENHRINQYTLGADYFYTLAGRFDHNQPFKLYWVTGGDIGAVSGCGKTEVLLAGSTGLLFDIKLTDNSYLFFETYFTLWTRNYDLERGWRNFDPTFSILGGLRIPLR